ncbi:SDR family NAD(P)-dependent oxidoreductase [Paenibacillus sp. NPDC093718]|uniref:SDR family NAD(P)-dependent oxidoreductase n=1 Tax=Paenibacillus sp. NPDC093718 TaxID=3390601 RepID=UPI003CFF4EE7
MDVRSSLMFSELMDAWAKRSPSERALVFLENGEDETAVLSYSDLHERAKVIARHLKDRGLNGERIMLLFPSGADYVAALLGCIYSGAIAVPAYPPRNNYHARRIAVIARDSGARTALALSHHCADISNRLKMLEENWAGDVIPLHEVEEPATGWINEELTKDHVAYLQYTSGSTGDPKGVMVRQGNLVHNCSIYQKAMDLPEGMVQVSWLPIFHDLGLVQGIILPLILGGTSVFMPPVSFIEHPVRWLRAIDRYQGEHTAAPNFAYDLCIHKISDDEISDLNLSSLRYAINGAEPISYDTLNAFAEKFRPCGYRAGTIFGGYGLAEATLFVTFGKTDRENPSLLLSKPALEKDQVDLCTDAESDGWRLVSSGIVLEDPLVRIVNPETGMECGKHEIGEIWLAGSSICAGYWNRPVSTEETFHAQLAGDDSNTKYLRTGDLGFILDGELYITGRLKDLIIIRGSNHYPQDIEKTVEEVSPELRKGGWGAAFTVLKEGVQKLVVVQEVERVARKRINTSVTGRAAASAVAEAHGIDLDIIVFVQTGSIPKTSSGKIQRKICKEMFENGSLKEIGRWERADHIDLKGKGLTSHMSLHPTQATYSEVMFSLKQIAAGLTGMAPEEIPPDLPFSAMGLNSIQVVELVASAGAAWGVSIPSTIAFEYPTLASLSEYLLGVSKPGMTDTQRDEPIAIVGLDCRFPGADGAEAFWELLTCGAEAIREVTEERQRLTGFASGEDASYRWFGQLDDIDRFDAALFGISPREAESMDPQQRILLETAWRALESANIAPDSLAGTNTGVFIGISSNDYFRLQLEHTGERAAYMGTGNALSVAANRISYCLGLQGVSLAIDTACSSSLVAVHQACRSLASGESHLAVAGGVNLILSDAYSQIFTQATMISPTGRCHTFDEQADGYVRGEGAGVLVLKRLSDARRDGNRILAVIRGSAVNQDGYSNGLTAPNGHAQQRVVNMALQRAGIPGHTIGYVETHGTGTPLGDPIEIRSLRAVLDISDETEATPCWLGAVKTNIGHLESASGIAGLIKTVLVLQHRLIPPNRNFRQLNPHIDLEESRFRLPTGPQEWKLPAGHSYRAGVSSFGFGGTNAHIILEGYEPDAAELEAMQPMDGQSVLLTLSARSESSLRELALQYANRLDSIEDDNMLPSICLAANTGRARLPMRVAVTGKSRGQLAGLLKDYAAGQTHPDISVGMAKHRPKIAFLFSGQGSQYIGMGRDLYAKEQVFKESMDHCIEASADLLNVPLFEVLFGSQDHLLDDTQYAQPALAALQMALVDLWRSWGIEPDVVVGHSIGEYAAAYAAGMLDRNTVMRLVIERGRLMGTVPGHGSMISVHAGAADIQEALGSLWPAVDVAAHNSPNQLVLSGDQELIRDAARTLENSDIQLVKLRTSHAFHSRLMEPVLEPFRATLEGVEWNEPRVQLVLTGNASGEKPGTDYWVDQIRQPVHFHEAMLQLETLKVDIFVEIGPGQTLTRLGQRCISGGVWLSSLPKVAAEPDHLQACLGQLFVQGAPVSFKPKKSPMNMPQASLPLYPFERKKYWFNREEGRSLTSHGSRLNEGGYPLIGRSMDIALEHICCYTNALPEATSRYLLDHRVGDQSIMPAAGYISMMLAAVRYSGWTRERQLVAVRDLRFHRPLSLIAEGVEVQTVLQRHDVLDMEWAVRVLSRDSRDGEWQTHATGTISKMVREPAACSEEETPGHPPGASGLTVSPPTGFLSIGNQSSPEAAGIIREFYDNWRRRGIAYETGFQAVESLKLKGDRIFGEIRLPSHVPELSGTIHPVLLDAAFQLLGALLLASEENRGAVPLPARLDALNVYESEYTTNTSFEVEGNLRKNAANGDELIADITLRHKNGNIAVEVVGLTAQWTDISAFRGNIPAELPYYSPAWEEVLLPFGHEAVIENKDLSTELWIYPAYAEGMVKVLTSEGGAASRYHIVLGHKNRQLSDHCWEVVYQDATIWPELVNWLPQTLGRIWFLGGMHHAEQSWEDIQTLSSHEQQGVITLFRLLRALSLNGYREKELIIRSVTNGVYSVEPGEAAQPLGAGIAGLSKTANREYSKWSLYHLDLDRDILEQDEPTLRDWIKPLNDIMSDLALRQGLPYQRILKPTGPKASGNLNLREQGVYLIFGGSGGISRSLSVYLAQKVKARLVLAGRSPSGRKQGEQIQEIVSAGGEAIYVQSDVTQLEDIRLAVARAKETFGAIHGIIHAAVVLRDKSMDNMDEEMLLEVLEPKVAGSAQLFKAAQNEELDFLIYFSSAQSFFGNAGQANYAAGSTFQDAVARSASGRVRFDVKSVNWGYWSEIGVASDEHYRKRLKNQGVDGITPAEGIQAFSPLLKIDGEQVVIIKAEPHILAQMGVITETIEMKRENIPSLIPAIELAQLPEEALILAVLHGLRDLIGSVLRIDAHRELASNERLMELKLTSLGIDSLMAMELRNQIRSWVGVDIPAHLFIGGSEVSEVVEMIRQKLLLLLLSRKSEAYFGDADEELEEFVL